MIMAYEGGTATPGLDIVGSMGAITVYGDSTAPVALSGSVRGVAVGDITLDFGNLQLNVFAKGGAAAADRAGPQRHQHEHDRQRDGQSGSIIGPLFDYPTSSPTAASATSRPAATSPSA